jgi:hypothetical protein
MSKSRRLEWSNRRIGFDGRLPVDAATTVAPVRSVLPVSRPSVQNAEPCAHGGAPPNRKAD